MAFQEREEVGCQRPTARGVFGPVSGFPWRPGRGGWIHEQPARSGQCLRGSPPFARVGKPWFRTSAAPGWSARGRRPLSRWRGRRPRPSAPGRRARDRWCPMAWRFLDGDAGLSPDPSARPISPTVAGHAWGWTRRFPSSVDHDSPA